MYDYDPLYNGWCYSFVEMPNLVKIQNELINLNKDGYNVTRSNPFYLNVFRDDVIRECPEVIRYLKSVKLMDIFSRILFSRNDVKLKANQKVPVVHVDGYNPKIRNHTALNLPLIDCEGTYTGFYSTDKRKLWYNYGTVDNYAWLPLDQVEEISRVEIVQPVVVNTTILHAAISDRPNRMIASFRFRRALNADDMKNMGIEEPFVQK
jgi:hypothetical protein